MKASQAIFGFFFWKVYLKIGPMIWKFKVETGFSKFFRIKPKQYSSSFSIF